MCILNKRPLPHPVPLTRPQVKSTLSFGLEAILSLAHLPKDSHQSLPYWTGRLIPSAETVRSLSKLHVSRLLRASSALAMYLLIAKYPCLLRSIASWTARI